MGCSPCPIPPSAWKAAAPRRPTVNQKLVHEEEVLIGSWKWQGKSSGSFLSGATHG